MKKTTFAKKPKPRTALFLALRLDLRTKTSWPHYQYYAIMVPHMHTTQEQHPKQPTARQQKSQQAACTCDMNYTPRLGLTINWLGISELVSLNPSNW